MNLNKKITTLFCLIIILGFPGGLQAEKMGTVVGEGARTCQKFLRARGKKQNNYIIWVQGYFTAYNAIAPDIKNVLGSQNYPWVLDRLKEICKEDPEQYFNAAVVTLTKELHPKGIELQ